MKSAFAGTTPDQPFLLVSQVVDLAEVEDRQVREPDGAGGLVEVTRKVPVWFRPSAEYGTPMCEGAGYCIEVSWKLDRRPPRLVPSHLD